ncbi:hypothetical protein PPL_05272 [Heterostelium album PN500]|uniref:IPT/TIG domain-containing protein n=1 Tax=Heterostelium pallidum (strain ATCC 26659 / Pp 5 / PN500) TaxID=670386 RepID=D3BB86_HETP5|nr:hypothetical protein PPL_05272 [Heterostelium album PN500]EFA81293.1 hypothetical protein PPL_05272 [Heterostelium album PN500]|eukprot:XP_020433411.1 hypothetical protein PPL_05272 [Heterostelium album PN500]
MAFIKGVNDSKCWIGTEKGVIYVYDHPSFSTYFTISDAHSGTVHTIKRIDRNIWTSSEKTICVFDDQLNVKKKIDNITSKVLSLTAHDRYVYASCWDTSILVFDKESFQCIQQLNKKHSDPVSFVVAVRTHTFGISELWASSWDKRISVYSICESDQPAANEDSSPIGNGYATISGSTSLSSTSLLSGMHTTKKQTSPPSPKPRVVKLSFVNFGVTAAAIANDHHPIPLVKTNTNSNNNNIISIDSNNNSIENRNGVVSGRCSPSSNILPLYIEKEIVKTVLFDRKYTPIVWKLRLTLVCRRWFGMVVEEIPQMLSLKAISLHSIREWLDQSQSRFALWPTLDTLSLCTSADGSTTTNTTNNTNNTNNNQIYNNNISSGSSSGNNTIITGSSLKKLYYNNTNNSKKGGVGGVVVGKGFHLEVSLPNDTELKQLYATVKSIKIMELKNGNENFVKYYDGYAIVSNVTVDTVQKVSALETSWGKLALGEFKNIAYQVMEDNSLNITITDDIVFRGLIRVFGKKKKDTQDFFWNPVIVSSISRVPTEGGTITVIGEYLQIVNNSPNSLIVSEDKKFKDQNNNSTRNIFYYSYSSDIIQNRDLDIIFKVRDSQFHFNYSFLEPNITGAYFENSSLIVDGSSFSANDEWIVVEIGDIVMKNISLNKIHVQVTSNVDSDFLTSVQYGIHPVKLKVNNVESNLYNLSIVPTFKDIKVNIDNSVHGGLMEIHGLFLYLKNSTNISITFGDLNCTVNTTLSNNGTLLYANIAPFYLNQQPGVNSLINTSIIIKINEYETFYSYGNITINSPNITSISDLRNGEVDIFGTYFGDVSKSNLEIKVDYVPCNITYHSDTLIKFIKPESEEGQRELLVKINGFPIDFGANEMFVFQKDEKNVVPAEEDKDKTNWIFMPIIGVSIVGHLL